MRNPRHYSGTTTCLVWVGVVAFGITFWAGVFYLVRQLTN
jgi:hypothetical protein